MGLSRKIVSNSLSTVTDDNELGLSGMITHCIVPEGLNVVEAVSEWDEWLPTLALVLLFRNDGVGEVMLSVSDVSSSSPG